MCMGEQIRLMYPFKLGDVVSLKATGDFYYVLGVESTGRRVCIVPRGTPLAEGAWVRPEEVVMRGFYPDGRDLLAAKAS
jgi:hypothetical protein